MKCACGEEIIGDYYVCKCGRRWEWSEKRKSYRFRGGHVYFRIGMTIVKVIHNTITRKSIEIICPKCGMWGKLVVRESGKRYAVVHGMRTCLFGKFSDWFELLDNIYNKVKRWD